MPIDPHIALAGLQWSLPTPLDSEIKAQQFRDLQTQGALRNLQLQAAKQQFGQEQQAQSAWKDALTMGPNGLQFDASKLYPALANAGQGQQAYQMQQEAQARQLAAKQAQRKQMYEESNHVINLLDGVKDQPTYDQAIQTARSMGMDTSWVQPRYDPNYVERLRNSALGVKGQIEQENKESDQEFREKQFGETKRHNMAMEKKKEFSGMGMGAGGGLSPEAIRMLAEDYKVSGALPNLGMGGASAAAKLQVANAAAKLGAENIASGRAEYGANKTSLVQAQKMRDSLLTFEKTALANADVFMAQAKKIKDTGSPAFNAPLRQAAAGMFGSEAQAAANTALQTIIPEFAKINSGSMNGILSDHARQEAAKLLPESATLGQYVAALNVLKQDAKNRHKYMDETIGEIKGRMGGSSAPAALKGAPPEVIRAYMSGKSVQGPDGKVYKKGE